MSCEHKLPTRYPGLYCFYCGNPVTELVSDEGQLKLNPLGTQNQLGAKYLAVISRQGQMEVASVQIFSPNITVKFKNGQSCSMLLSKVLKAFQDDQEWLKDD